MFSPGSTIHRREVLHGAVWLSTPVTVLNDGDVLAVRLDPGAPMTYPPHPFGPHPWSGTTHWTTTTVLQLYRPGDWYALWRMFDDTRDLGWYVNFEAPLTRGTAWFDTVDYGLDIVIPPDERWRWKDVDDVNAQLACGRIDATTADQIERAADEVAADLDADRRWWATWDDWRPPLSPTP